MIWEGKRREKVSDGIRGWELRRGRVSGLTPFKRL